MEKLWGASGEGGLLYWDIQTRSHVTQLKFELNQLLLPSLQIIGQCLRALVSETKT